MMSDIDYPHQRALDSQRAARGFAGQALNALFLVNGGALIALLALAGSYAQGGKPPPSELTLSGHPFALGLSLAVGAAIAAYATQFSLSSYREGQAGQKNTRAWQLSSLVLGGLTMVLMLGSLMYAIGGFNAVADSFVHMPAIAD